MAEAAAADVAEPAPRGAVGAAYHSPGGRVMSRAGLTNMSEYCASSDRNAGAVSALGRQRCNTGAAEQRQQRELLGHRLVFHSRASALMRTVRT